MSYKNQPPKSAQLNASFIAAVDAFISAPKTILGADESVSWVIARQQESELTAKFPLAIEGVIDEPKLVCIAYPNEHALKFRVLITFEPAICRLDFDHAGHGNNHALYFSDIPALCKGPHYHSWEDNRQFFTTSTKPIELHNARDLAANIQTFDSALRWFCERNNIKLPAGHRIELPPRSQLF